MPGSNPRQRTARKGHFSCDFCRARKLRCDRPLPCTSCRSRGKTCQFDNETLAPATPGSRILSPPVPATVTTVAGAPYNTQDQGPLAQFPLPQLFQQPFTPTLTPDSTVPLPVASQHKDLLAEIQNLRRLTERLEERVIQTTTPQQHHDVGPASLSSTPLAGDDELTFQSNLEQMGDVVAHLQRVSMGRSLLDSVCAEDMVIKVGPIRTIPGAPAFTMQSSKPTLCIWLPHYLEAKALVENYLRDISYIQHVVHHPSLPATIEEVYRQIGSCEPVNSGHLVILLSILASATHVWTPHERTSRDNNLFLSSAQANAQTPLWVKATYTVLNVAQGTVIPTLETVQGVIILSCVVASLEGVSMRLRSLLSTGLLLCRELNFHRTDHGLNATNSNGIRNEMARRVWWYLVATDWLMAARYGGLSEGVYQTHPLHMIVNKPRNLDDIRLVEDDPNFEMPTSQPTSMSYFLQRLRLAEISRSIVDHNLVSTTGLGRPNYYTHIMAMDFELNQFISQTPRYFQLDSYEPFSTSSRASNFYIQAYMLNSHVHTQRCKLHLAYLTSGPSDNPAHAASRHTCLQSARHIIRAEQQLLGSGHSFVRIRLRLAAILYSVFMASIVLLMDACVNRPISVQDEGLDDDAAEALKILEDIRSHSLAAAKLLESLLQVVSRYRGSQHSTSDRAFTLLQDARCSSASVYSKDASSACVHREHEMLPTNRGVSHGAFTDQTPQHDDFLMDGQQDAMDPDHLEWNDLFSDLASASFF